MGKCKIRLSNSFISDLKNVMIALTIMTIFLLITAIVSIILGYILILLFPQIVNILNVNLSQSGQSLITGIFILSMLLIIFMIISIPKDDYMSNKRIFEFRKNDIGHIKIKYSLKQYILDKLSFVFVSQTIIKDGTETNTERKRDSGEWSN